MNREALLKHFTAMLDEFERNRTFGSVEFCFNNGRVQVIRELKSWKIFDSQKGHTYGHHGTASDN
jgi:hypothetical protein